ncbi:MAG: hypothetical protein R6V37_05560 [Psychroflexus maritimus]
MSTDETLNKGKGFFKQIVDNVSEGASLVTEKIKETSAKAYVSGNELVESTNEKIHNFTDRQALTKEKNKLEEQQEELTYNFGKQTLQNYLSEGHLHKVFLTKKAVNDIVETYKENAKRIKTLEKDIKKLDNQ